MVSLDIEFEDARTKVFDLTHGCRIHPQSFLEEAVQFLHGLQGSTREETIIIS